MFLSGFTSISRGWYPHGGSPVLFYPALRRFHGCGIDMEALSPKEHIVALNDTRSESSGVLYYSTPVVGLHVFFNAVAYHYIL